MSWLPTLLPNLKGMPLFTITFTACSAGFMLFGYDQGVSNSLQQNGQQKPPEKPGGRADQRRPPARVARADSPLSTCSAHFWETFPSLYTDSVLLGAVLGLL